ncbi:hypothetical protein [Pontibacter pamirensis]|uniref:hypothetical protein n=1 Tax=Pontibacter pamirensis TaxID=2562824 RepID=UPI0013897A35|nr:hypothetical protein [Pontibacter pamirensis]
MLIRQREVRWPQFSQPYHCDTLHSSAVRTVAFPPSAKQAPPLEQGLCHLMRFCFGKGHHITFLALLPVTVLVIVAEGVGVNAI